ncbi:HNH_endonuclease [Hexamita inflata]|uniref:HNH_endonuclease n=1 Tax=Hexamita inflata TaxID=28002 RepID=A0ABP1KEI4_9EUKA
MFLGMVAFDHPDKDHFIITEIKIEKKKKYFYLYKMTELFKELDICSHYIVTIDGNVFCKPTQQKLNLICVDGKFTRVRLDIWSSQKKLHILNVHRLVAETFIENPNNYKYVKHLDGDIRNNHVSNLQWCKCSRLLK